MRPELFFRASLLAACLCAPAAQATTVTLNDDFEQASGYTLGSIGGNPNAGIAGQGGWIGYGYAEITDEQAHSGAQSLKIWSSSGFSKLLDSTSQDRSFNIGYANDWWVQGWMYIPSGSAAAMTLANGLGGCPLGSISSAGVFYANSCTVQTNVNDPQFNVASQVFDHWVNFQMWHTASQQQAMNFSLTGNGIDIQVTLDQYTGPGSALPSSLAIGNQTLVYYDDLRAGYGAMPAAVPLPAAAWLFASGLAGMIGLARRKMS